MGKIRPGGRDSAVNGDFRFESAAVCVEAKLISVSAVDDLHVLTHPFESRLSDAHDLIDVSVTVALRCS